MNKRLSYTRVQGFTLLEALIAMLILSIGLLGLAGLQASSSRLGYEAHMRSITTLAASEIIEKIRMRTGKVPQTARPGIIQQYLGGAAAGCDPTVSSVANDLACWQKSLAAELPEGEGTITNNGTNSFQVQISWYDRELGQPSTVSWTYAAGP